MHSTFAIFLLAALLGAVSVQGTSFGVYHLSRRQVAANDCEFIKLPWNFCPACRLKPFNGTGADLDFGEDAVNRFDIYDLSTRWCQNMMKQYVAQNPCDTVRRDALAKFDTKAGYGVMIYFMYSICETCCDCVPIGAREEEYEERLANGTLINIYRGNCAAHYFYDTCRVLPNSKQFGNLKTKERNNTAMWCDDFETWQFSNYSKRWLRNPNVDGTTTNMDRGMNELMRSARCTEEKQWKKCVRMEHAQGRV